MMAGERRGAGGYIDMETIVHNVCNHVKSAGEAI